MNDKCELCKNYVCDRCTMAEDPYNCNAFKEKSKFLLMYENYKENFEDFFTYATEEEYEKYFTETTEKIIEEYGFCKPVKNMVLIKNTESKFFICADNKDERYYIVFFKKYELGEKNVK